jgi:hypothetical protein
VNELPGRALIIHAGGDKRRQQNVERLQGFLRRVGIADVQVFDAVCPPDSGPMFSPGEWGCFQSHLACLRIAAAEPSGSSTMILEDDAVFRYDVSEVRQALSDAATEPWDILHIGHTRFEILRSWDEKLVNQPWHRVRGLLLGAQCYVVRADGIRPRVEQFADLAHEDPATGGGVGTDGAFSELAYRDPTFIRVAPINSMTEQLFGIRSTIREDEPISWRIRALRARQAFQQWRRAARTV